MKKTKPETTDEIVVTDDADLAELEAMLDDGTEPENVVDTTAEMTETDIEADLEAVESAIAVDEARDAAYAEAEGDGEAIAPPSEAAPKKERTPRASFDRQSDALFHKIGSDAAMELALTVADAEKDATARKDEIAALIDGQPKKVQEKSVNLIACAVKGGTLSNYTVIALKALLDRGAVTSAELRAAYETNPEKAYGKGTANAQAGQMMRLFPDLGIAVKDGKTLKVNEDSVLIPALRGLLSDVAEEPVPEAA